MTHLRNRAEAVGRFCNLLNCVQRFAVRYSSLGKPGNRVNETRIERKGPTHRGANPNPGEAKAAEAKEADGDAQELSVMVMVRNHQIDLASRQALLATLPGVVSMLDLTFYNASLNAADISALAKILNTTAIATLKIEYTPNLTDSKKIARQQKTNSSKKSRVVADHPSCNKKPKTTATSIDPSGVSNTFMQQQAV